MAKQHDGKVALITGGASGIGKATALAFAHEGAKVWITDVQEKEGLLLAEQIRMEGGLAFFHACDVSDAGQVEEMVAKAEERLGRLDFACNNAGIEPKTAATAETEEADFSRILDVNLKGVWLCMKYEIPCMLKQGGGAIVNISSIAGVVGFQGASAYVASKHGVVGLTKTAALEYAKQGIRVNAICPGIIQTPMIDRYTQGDEKIVNMLKQGVPMGRIGKPEEIASAVLWLCSSGAAFTTGHALVVDGGWVSQ